MPWARLITASSTTSWLDWIHGELWLFPDGLLRVRTSLAQTQAHKNQRTVPPQLPTREFSSDEIRQLVALHRTNRWIPADQIERAAIHTGRSTSRLNVWTRDGRKFKLLWLRVDEAEKALSEALASWKVETELTTDS